MKAIVDKQQRRRDEGKETVFRVRGQPVDQAKINRWLKREENIYSMIASDQPAASRKGLEISLAIPLCLIFPP